jgi:molybdopterin-synthase adenylyltransferase
LESEEILAAEKVLEERYSRQKDVVPPEKLADCDISVIGVGAIGRQVALQLAAMGAPKLQLVDFDTVEVSNIASQGYWEEDIDKPKIEATAAACKRINSSIEVIEHNGRFRRSLELGNAMFCCVDDIEIRALIFEAIKENTAFFIDGRMTAETVRVITAFDNHSMLYYPKTLFTSGEAFEGTCTSKSTIFTANIAAGLMVEQFTKWLREMIIDQDLMLNLLASELEPYDAEEAEDPAITAAKEA